MQLLIDGYNLLHATDLFGQGALAGTLRGSREALLGFLASRLTARERRATTIVFDAASAPPGLPAQQSWEGVTVLFARGYPDADAMLEDLIERAPAPKELLVVSSDHRVQRAARLRGAAWVESETWRRELQERTQAHPRAVSDKGPPDGQVGDTAYWVEQFSTSEDEPGSEETPPPGPPAEDKQDRSTAQPAESTESPFPPGYAEDLASELEQSDAPSSPGERRGGGSEPS